MHRYHTNNILLSLLLMIFIIGLLSCDYCAAHSVIETCKFNQTKQGQYVVYLILLILTTYTRIPTDTHTHAYRWNYKWLTHPNEIIIECNFICCSCLFARLHVYGLLLCFLFLFLLKNLTGVFFLSEHKTFCDNVNTQDMPLIEFSIRILYL